jgi:hypothetical protein
VNQPLGGPAGVNERGFALTGLTSRGGLSSWVFFFFPERLVMIDVGLKPALKAGAEAGLAGGGIDSPYGPQRPPAQALASWCERLRAGARVVVELPDPQIRRVRLHLRAMAHQLFLESADGAPHRFTLMNRPEAAPAAVALARLLGDRFATTTSAVYAFLSRHARFLVN